MKQVNLSDHDFARYLTSANAIDNYEHHGNSTWWRNSRGDVVAVAFFDNKQCTRTIHINDSHKGE